MAVSGKKYRVGIIEYSIDIFAYSSNLNYYKFWMRLSIASVSEWRG